MKNKTYILVIIFIAFLLNSCQDVINVDLKTDNPKLVIEASINWYKGTTGKDQKIKLTTTTNYYTNTIPVVSGAIISVKNADNIVFNFIEKPNTGEYFCSNFAPILNDTYTLSITSNGQTYNATETLKPVAPIEKIEQNNQGGIAGNATEIRAFYIDPVHETNYYLYQYKYPNKAKADYYVDQDVFFQGNTFFSVSQNDKLKTGDIIEISHYGISKVYYNYMNILLANAGNTGAGPFQSPPATVKGNIVNKTNFDNYPLGYFRLSEVDSKEYTVK